jgi:hypothetical protein
LAVVKQELEDILETYFAQLDRTCSRLRGLDEHVSQTEDFVNIDLARPRFWLLSPCVSLSDAPHLHNATGFKAQHAD